MERPASRLQRELKQTRPFGSRRHEATLAILRTADVVKRRISERIEPHGITLQQYNVLRILRGAHPDALPTLEIADRLIERMPGITRLLDRLEVKGLVVRERTTTDRRLVNCRITESGLALLAPLDEEVDADDAAIIGDLHDAEVEALIGILEKVRQ
jgi:DNA-binding MarR family transcriptional regulator